MRQSITIIGDGAMGTVSGIILAGNGHDVRLWGAFPDAIESMRKTHRNERFLPGVEIPSELQLTSDDKACLDGVTLVVSAVPTQYLRRVWQRLSPHLPAGVPIVSCTKGIENSTLLRPSEIISQTVAHAGPVCALSGPNIAGEIARKLPATAVAAAKDNSIACTVQAAYSNQYFRVYTNADVVGVEIAGAVKNVIALAAGIIDGLDLGCNAKAALLARGLVEITRLGVALGANPVTFAGLAGMGDLVTTCISPEGRNRRTGEALGRGQTLEHILAGTASVVEGVTTTRSVMELATRHNIEMPITAAVHAILFENVTPAAALQKLMARQSRPESA